MNTRDRYNRMIEKIEKEAAGINLAEDILKDLLKSEGWDSRSLGEVFKFMTGKSLMEYIKERQFMLAYQCLISEDGDIQQAIDISGMSGNSSFDKKFKQIFGISPMKAKQQHEKDLYKPPLTWEEIGKDGTDTRIRTKEEKRCMLKFDIEEVKLQKYNEARDLQVLYGFTDRETEVAFDYAKRKKISMEEAFEAISSGVEALYTGSKKSKEARVNCSEGHIEWICDYADTIRYLTNQVGMGHKEADYLSMLIVNCVGDIEEEPVDAIRRFRDNTAKFFTYAEFRDAYDCFFENGGEDSFWDKYIMFIGLGYEFEDAFYAAKEEYEEFEEGLDQMEDVFDDEEVDEYDNYQYEKEDRLRQAAQDRRLWSVCDDEDDDRGYLEGYNPEADEWGI